VADYIERTTVTGVDVNGDGELDDDEIVIDQEVAVRKDLVEE
jgi:hypothetical protein